MLKIPPEADKKSFQHFHIQNYGKENMSVILIKYYDVMKYLKKSLYKKKETTHNIHQNIFETNKF